MTDQRDPAIIAFDKIQTDWIFFYNELRGYLHGLDGDLSRSIGEVVMTILNEDKAGEADHTDWRTIAVARFLKNDPELWHELADSRKK